MMKNKKPGTLIAIANQKGGVGKTTVACNLAAALGLGGYRCLIVDLDPAAGATKHLGVPVNSFAGTLELLTTDEDLEALAISDRMPNNVELVPSRSQLCELDSLLSRFVDRTRILERTIASARERYDFIFLDTAPSAADITTVAAYSTAEWFLLSTFPHPLSLLGIDEVLRDIGDVRKHRNSDLEILGVVFSNVDGRATRLRAQLESMVHDALPGRQFKTYISQAIILPELSGKGRTLFQQPGYTRLHVAQQYLRLAAEVEHRVLNRQAFLAGELAPLQKGTCRTPHTPDMPAEFTFSETQV